MIFFGFNRHDLSGRLLCLILIVTLVLGMSVPAYGAVTSSEPQIVISDAAGKGGETVQIAVDLKNNPGITAIDFQVVYDGDVLELLSQDNGNLLEGLTVSPNIGGNPFYCGWINSLQKENCDEDGNLDAVSSESETV